MGDVHGEMMSRALDLATAARERGDHLFGSLLVVDGEVVETARNRMVTDGDGEPSHAVRRPGARRRGHRTPRRFLEA